LLHIERSGAGRPFVWAHGLTSSIAAEREGGLFQWESVEGIDLVRYDALGHGESPSGSAPEEYQWSRLASDFLAVADEVGAESMVAGGASMGCATVLYAALAAPSRMQALVLAIPPTAWETRAAQGDVYLKSADFLESRGMDAYLEASRRLPANPPWSADRREARLARLATMDPASLATVLRGAATSNLPPRDEVASITCPVLVLAWEDDPGHPLSTASSLHELLPASQLVVARSFEEAAAWPSAVSDFLSSV
jgi:pimeloyl-ACP methyl ester carboxylesterase